MRSEQRPRPPSLRDIRREISGTKGRYVMDLPGGEAELTYSISSPNLIIADHTNVPDTARGTGAGVSLAEQLVSDARVEGVRIIALCQFVKAQARNHPDWADVIV